MSLTTPTINSSKVTGLDPRPGHTLATLADGRVEVVPGVADLTAARRWRRAVSAVHGVEIVMDGRQVRCLVRFTPRRRLQTQPVPLRLGLGLATLGVPAELRIRQEVR